MDIEQQQDVVLAGLRRLRERRGLTTARLAREGAVLSALGTSDPEHGLARLHAALDTLGDGSRPWALRVDFGLDLDRLLKRRPSTRELDLLGDRRAGYAETIGRSVKTLARWSDEALAELRASLIDDTFTGNLYVVALVKDLRIVNLSLIEEDLADAREPTSRRSTDLPTGGGDPTIPALIYAFPRDWRPSKLQLAAVFRGAKPLLVHALAAHGFLELPNGRREPLAVDSEGVAACSFFRPSRSLLYGIAWW